ncbi:MAG TPA: BREX-1 system phosphatase PglZ type B, partial [Acetobacteraceae bacterium]|nr:BREX-1 system phosphatase PglZ type B [Acetobacteraceae bacterium]
LIAALRSASAYDARAETPPEGLLWCDPANDFFPLLPLLRQHLPNLLTLGEHEPERRQGPAVWLRTAAGRALPDITWPPDVPAIVYLPNVARDALRAAEDCPPRLQLLAWLVVGGAAFVHPNGRDWTLRGFLATKPANGGLGLEVPQDEATRQALLLAAPKLFTLPVAELQGRRLDADWLHALLAPDLNEDMLAWLDGKLDAASDPARFAAFQAQAKSKLKLDPAKVSRERAAERLLQRGDAWAPIWSRFTSSAPEFHENLVSLLVSQEPPAPLLADPTVYPAVNARQEAELRAALVGLKGKSPADAAQVVYGLASAHAIRREGPWAARGLAPLAQAVAHLAELAVTPPLPAGDPEALAEAYVADGWKADWCALAALMATAPAPKLGALATVTEDRAAVVAALHALYLPRLEREANVLQDLLSVGLPPTHAPGDADTLLFVDGLRMDLAQHLAVLLRRADAKVDLEWRWSGFPTVTATCKPLASPAAGKFKGGAVDGFAPSTADGKPVGKSELLKELQALGWEADELLLATGKNWLETGHIDHDGHQMQGRLAEQLTGMLQIIAAEVLRRVSAGRRVRVVTDHGWLLLPGGLPVAKLGSGLTDTQWSRCATVKEGSAAAARQFPWSWNKVVMVATAPGAHVFRGGMEYAHGGISPQECIVPELAIAPLQAVHRAIITEVTWDNFRVRVRADGGDGLMADLRLGSDGEGKSIIDKPRPLDAEGRTSLLLSDDTVIGQAALLTLRDSQDRLVASKATVVGG